MEELDNLEPPIKNQGAGSMELLIFFGVLAVWIFFQAWLLPRMGVGT
jgi:hypothetical protein